MKLQFIRIAGVFAASAAMTFVATTATADFDFRGMYDRWYAMDCDTLLVEGAPEGEEHKLERCETLEHRISTVKVRLEMHEARLPKLQARLDTAIEEGKSGEKLKEVRDLIAETKRRISKLIVLLHVSKKSAD